MDWNGIQTLRFGGATSLSESDAPKEWTLSSSDHRPSVARSMPSDGSMSISIVLFAVDGIRDGSATTRNSRQGVYGFVAFSRD